MSIPLFEDIFIDVDTSIKDIYNSIGVCTIAHFPFTITMSADHSKSPRAPIHGSLISFSEFQHGIRAQGLWRDKNHSLSRKDLMPCFKLEIPSDYTVWSYTTLTFYTNSGLSPFLLGEVPKPVLIPDDTESEWLLSRWLEFDSTAMSCILSSVGKSQIAMLTQCTSASEMWTKLKDMYAHKSDANIARLENELSSIYWKDSHTLETYI